MKLVSFLILLISAMASLGLHAQEENPFNDKFGGPYATGVSTQFRKDALNVAQQLRTSLNEIDKASIKTDADFRAYLEKVIDPGLEKLKPATEEEKRMKEGVVYLKTVLMSVADPKSLPAAELAVANRFLVSCRLEGQPNTLANQFGGLLVRYASFCGGGFTEELRKAAEAAEASPGKVPDPFASRFGGPYKDLVSPAYRSAIAGYAHGLLTRYTRLDKATRGNRASFDAYCKEFIDPTLGRLAPASDAEKKMKEAAAYMKVLHAFVVDPSTFSAEDRQLHQAFPDACMLPGVINDNPSRLFVALLRFQAFGEGVGVKGGVLPKLPAGK